MCRQLRRLTGWRPSAYFFSSASARLSPSWRKLQTTYLRYYFSKRASAAFSLRASVLVIISSNRGKNSASAFSLRRSNRRFRRLIAHSQRHRAALAAGADARLLTTMLEMYNDVKMAL